MILKNTFSPLFLGLLLLSIPVWAEVSVNRSLPKTYTPSQPVTVVLKIAVSGNAPFGIIIKELIPVGWTLSSANPQVSLNEGGEIGWVLYDSAGIKNQEISYTLSVPMVEAGTKTFSGTVKYLEDTVQKTVAVIGDASIIPYGFIPTPTAGDKVQVTRTLPDSYAPQGTVPVKLQVDINGIGPTGLIIKETIPTGWTLITASPKQSMSDGNEIGWVLFDAYGVKTQTIQYALSVPASESGIKIIAGEFKYLDGSEEKTSPTGGNSTLTTSSTLPTPTPLTPTPPPQISPTPTQVPQTITPVYVNKINKNDLAGNGIGEIAGTFAGLKPALVTVTDLVPADGAAQGVEGNALRVNVQTDQGTLLLFGNQNPIPVNAKVLMRVSLWVNNPSVQIFTGVIDTNSSGVITSADLGMQQLSKTTSLTKTWSRLTALHESQSGFVVPFVQIVGAMTNGEAYIDTVELYLIKKDTLYPGELLGVK